MCRFFRMKPADWRMSSGELRGLITSSFPTARIFLWDRWYYYVKHEDWGKILKDVHFDMPNYTTERFDCENFAMLCSCRVSERYKINTVGVAIGQSPLDRHGFNLFVSRVDEEPRLYISDPQTGDVYTPEEPSGYDVDLVIFG